MTGSKIPLCLLRLWLFVTVATVAGASVLPVLAHGGLTIESPSHGSTVSSNTLPRPQGHASSPSQVRSVQVLLQRANSGVWLSWDGSRWSNALMP